MRSRSFRFLTASVGVFDAKGVLVDDLLELIPEERAQDVILFEAADPIPIDFMSWDTEADSQNLAGSLFSAFMRFSKDTEGDVWGAILRATIHTLLAARARQCCFRDIYHFHTGPHRTGENTCTGKGEQRKI